MMRQFFRYVLGGSKRSRKFSAWQIELTTRCPLKCRMCIRDASPAWHTGDMDINDFRRLGPYLRDVDSVVLEGWGEPLLYRNLPEAVRIAKKAGCRAGFVTSGWGLDEPYASDLIDSGLDFIGFSLSGATAKTHDSIRVHSHLPGVLQSIGSLMKARKDKGLNRPEVHIVYLMLKSNLEEIPLLPRLARELGVEDIVLINLILAVNAFQDHQRVFGCEMEGRDIETAAAVPAEAEAAARNVGVRLRAPALSPAFTPVCEENPLRNLYIAVTGEVAPCVFLHPPVPSPFEKFFCGLIHPAEKVSFGNIFREPLDTIWNSSAYTEFRHRFLEREKRFGADGLSLGDWGPRGLQKLRDPGLPSPPEPCRTCHKILGF